VSCTSRISFKAKQGMNCSAVEGVFLVWRETPLSRLRNTLRQLERSNLGHFFRGRSPVPPLFRLRNTFDISEFSISLFWGETPQARLLLGLRTPFLTSPTISWVLRRRAF
jgi:hypothetical protein